MFQRTMCLLALLALAPLTAAQDLPAVLRANDAAAIEAAKDASVIVVGKVTKAEWSRSGKVLNIEFEGATNFTAAEFERQKAKLDESFSGDFGKALTGAIVRLNGKIQPYGGHDQTLKNTLQLLITDSSQVTVVQPATPTTRPQ